MSEPLSAIESKKLFSDLETFCQEVRVAEEVCYLEHRFNPDTVALARKYQLMGIPIPKKYGGRGADLSTYAQCLVRIGREGTGVRTFFSGHTSIGQYPLLRYGNEKQKEKYLPLTCRGEKVMAFGLTEPQAGSNPLEMQTTYRREGDFFVLNGIKYLISNGGIADALIVFAYPEEGEKRISAFIVDGDAPGMERENLTAKVGIPTSNTAMFELTNYRVPVENLLGDEGDGFRIAMGTLISGRMSVGAGCLGVIEDCLHEALDYAKQRQQHGKAIASHQLIQEHLAEIEMARQTTQSLMESALKAKAKSDADPENSELYERADLLAAKFKLHASNAAFQAADRTVQIFGGRGYSELFRPGRHWQDVRVCRIYEGTDEILKLKIAAGLLGKDYVAFH